MGLRDFLLGIDSGERNPRAAKLWSSNPRARTVARQDAAEVLYSPLAGLDPGRDLPLTFSHFARCKFQQILSWTAGEEILAEYSPCAVIVTLAPHLLECPDYQAFVAACVARASEQEEFRFYVYLVDLTFQDFVDLAHSDGFLRQLADTVNIPGVTGNEALAAIDASLAAFLSNLGDIEDAPRCRMRLLKFFTLVSALSVPLGISALGAFALSAAYSVTGTPIPGGILGSLVASGNSYFFLTAVLLILAQHRFRWLLIPAASVAAGLIFVLAPSYLPVLGGLGLALGTDYCRRSWIQLSTVDLARPEEGTAQKESWMQVSNPFRILYHGYVLPRRRSVFLSYARRTWCDGIVRELRLHLRELDTECFLDIADIELGASWRRALEDGIRKATVMVFFDQDEPQDPPRFWHRAELITAAALNARTDLPRIVVVTPESAGAIAIESYREKLKNLTGVAEFRIVPLSPHQTAAFASTIAGTPVAPCGGSWHPHFDLLVAIPAVNFIKILLTVISWLGMVFFLSYISLVLALGKLLFSILGSSFPIPVGILSIVLCLAAGFGFRSRLHSLYESPIPMVRNRDQSVQVIVAAMNIVIGAIFLVDANFGWWIMSAACFLLGFVGLDHTVRWASHDPVNLK